MQFPRKIFFKTSTIADGNMSLRFGEENVVLENRSRFVGNKNFVAMACDHGELIKVVTQPSQEMPLAEVLVTQTPNLALMVLTADCLPVGFYDPVTKTIALAHMSRVTIANELPQKTVGWLRQKFSVNPATLHVFIGPHIHKASYSFPNTSERFPEPIEQFVTRTSETVSIDLVSAHNHQLAEAGIHKENIQANSIDTYTSPNHFSHLTTKKDGRSAGRLATVLTLSQ